MKKFLCLENHKSIKSCGKCTHTVNILNDKGMKGKKQQECGQEKEKERKKLSQLKSFLFIAYFACTNNNNWWMANKKNLFDIETSERCDCSLSAANGKKAQIKVQKFYTYIFLCV